MVLLRMKNSSRTEGEEFLFTLELEYEKMQFIYDKKKITHTHTHLKMALNRCTFFMWVVYR